LPHSLWAELAALVFAAAGPQATYKLFLEFSGAFFFSPSSPASRPNRFSPLASYAGTGSLLLGFFSQIVT